MRVIIAGTRDITDAKLLRDTIRASQFVITEVVSGGAAGVDTLGEQWALSVGIPVRRYPADWKQHGRAAGPIRNEEMAKYAEALIAVWDGESLGTCDMLRRARKHGLKVYCHTLFEDPLAF